MNLPIRLTLAASGVFLMAGLLGGILKYRGIMTNPGRRAHPYIDMAHRASMMYSFAALVMATLLNFSPYSEKVQLVITGVPLIFFAVSVGQYFRLGISGRVTDQFAERNFTTTWGMGLLIAGELGGVGAIVWGFISSQVLG
jgi:hypothetical protein